MSKNVFARELEFTFSSTCANFLFYYIFYRFPYLYSIFNFFAGRFTFANNPTIEILIYTSGAYNIFFATHFLNGVIDQLFHNENVSLYLRCIFDKLYISRGSLSSSLSLNYYNLTACP